MDFLSIQGQKVVKPDSAPIFWRPSGYAIVLSKDKTSILMVKAHGIDGLNLPGGGIEPQETTKEGIAREVLEETGHFVSIENQQIHQEERLFYNEFNGKYYHALLFFYYGTLISKDPTKNFILDKKEIEFYKWIPLSEIVLTDCHFTCHQALSKVLDEK